MTEDGTSAAEPRRGQHLDEAPGSATAAREADEARLRAMVKGHLDFTWRSLRRLGLPADVADDAAQRVFLVASRRLATIQPGTERAFLFNTALRVAASEKRSFARRREVLTQDEEFEAADAAPGADEILDRQRARDTLEKLLDELPLELRAVFILFELEGMSTPEIAATLDVPVGTAASRLRRAREEFQSSLKRHQARATHARPTPGGRS
jgi:RNA polymerase sigma-70 factor (ECF subfamily)